MRSSAGGRSRRAKILVALAVALGLFALAAYVVAAHGVALAELGYQWKLERALPDQARLATTRGFVQRYAGGRGDPLVLVHGFGARASNWGRVIPDLARRYRVIALDLAGHGRSDPRHPPLSFRDLRESLEVALESEREPLVIVGNSLGGWLALQFALDHPDRVRRLVLVNSAGASGAQVTREALLPPGRERAQRTVDTLLGRHATELPDYVLDQLVERAGDPRLASLWNQLSQGPFLDARLSELELPVVLAWGTPDPWFPVAGYADRLARRLPRARLALLEGCGHVPQISCPDQLARVIVAGASADP